MSISIRDNYGFVSFRNKDDAYEAVEHGNDDPSYPRVDLCFGGRRKFCKQKYSDLGKRLKYTEKDNSCTLNKQPAARGSSRGGIHAT